MRARNVVSSKMTHWTRISGSVFIVIPHPFPFILHIYDRLEQIPSVPNGVKHIKCE